MSLLLAAKVWICSDRQRQCAYQWTYRKGFNEYAIRNVISHCRYINYATFPLEYMDSNKELKDRERIAK